MNKNLLSALISRGPALAALLAFTGPATAQEVMRGVPPERDSQATFENYRASPYNQWTFRNMGAPTHVVMIPRQGPVHSFDKGKIKDWDSANFDKTFADNNADGVVVVQGNKLLHERYFNGLGPHDQHIWFSMTKSLVSASFGRLVESENIDLQASPASLIPELKDSGFARTTIQQVLDHASAIDFKENYTDPESDFFRFYAPALGMAWLPGAADAKPDSTDIYGVHDFLTKFVKADTSLKPGSAFDYNSANADVLGWIVARLSGQSLQDYLQETIWSRIGAEHDAFIIVDRAYMPVATGGMNSTLRDASRFGMMVRDKGRFNGNQVLPAAWLEQTVQLNPTLTANMDANQKYLGDPWQAYHNMWWVLDADQGEFAAVGIHGQVIYINRGANTVIAWFSSQPGASSAKNPTFHAKLTAARKLAAQLSARGSN